MHQIAFLIATCGNTCPHESLPIVVYQMDSHFDVVLPSAFRSVELRLTNAVRKTGRHFYWVVAC
jgi:hypothetical protein